MIDKPFRNPKGDTLRALIEATAQATPVTAALAHLYGTTHPTMGERDRERWEDQVTNELNKHGSPIHAWGEISCLDIHNSYNITSIVDRGIGDISINFASCIDGLYHVNVDLPSGEAHAQEKRTTGFRILTTEDGHSADIPSRTTFVCLKLST